MDGAYNKILLAENHFQKERVSFCLFRMRNASPRQKERSWIQRHHQRHCCQHPHHRLRQRGHQGWWSPRSVGYRKCQKLLFFFNENNWWTNLLRVVLNGGNSLLLCVAEGQSGKQKRSDLNSEEWVHFTTHHSQEICAFLSDASSDCRSTDRPTQPSTFCRIKILKGRGYWNRILTTSNN